MELNELFRTTTSKLLILIFAKEKKASSLRYGRPECIALLLSFGADVDVRGELVAQYIPAKSSSMLFSCERAFGYVQNTSSW